MGPEALEVGELFSFGDWPNSAVPKGPQGVYSVWRGDEFIYVGMSWREPSPDGAKSSPGLWGRLNSHASGRRSGDQFCIYVCDRYVLGRLGPGVIASIAAGEVSLDVLTRQFIRQYLSYRFVLTATGAEARALEARIRRDGLPAAGGPTLNPLERARL